MKLNFKIMITKNKIISTMAIVIAVLAFLLLQTCNNSNTSTVTLKTPEVKGTFKTDTIEIQKTIYVPKTVFNRSNEDKLKNDISSLNNQLELYKEELDNAIDEFTYLDSINKIKMYAEAIALREFNQPFEDDFIKINNSGFTFGSLKSLSTSYTIKSKEVNAAVPQLKYRILVGAGAGFNTQLNQSIYKINLGYQNKAANIYRISFSQIGTQQFGLFEYDLNLFTHKK
jgi:hypothetical protein